MYVARCVNQQTFCVQPLRLAAKLLLQLSLHSNGASVTRVKLVSKSDFWGLANWFAVSLVLSDGREVGGARAGRPARADAIGPSTGRVASTTTATAAIFEGHHSGVRDIYNNHRQFIDKTATETFTTTTTSLR